MTSSPGPAPALTLVRDGRALFCLEIQPPQYAAAVRHVCDALLEHLERCLGDKVTWFDRRATTLPPVHLVLQWDVRADLAAQEFEIEAQPQALILRARTPQALDLAVHHFLEEAFGVRWLWPGPDGTVTPRVPSAGAVSWPIGCTRHAPDYLWRQLWIGGAWYREDDGYLAERKYGRISDRTLNELFTWHRRQRLGGLNIADGHRWAQICSPLVFGQTHPEYFALVKGQRDIQYQDGKHGNQPCTSNPDVVALTADYIKAQFRAQPQLDGFSIATNDGLGFCECPHCVAIDRQVQADSHRDGDFDALTREQPGVPQQAQRSITDRMLRFANAVAQEVAKTYPDKLLLTLIYSLYRNPPRQTTLHPNVIAQFCSLSHTHAEPAVFEAEMAVFNELGRFAPTLGIYDYIVNGSNGTLPRGISHTLLRSLRHYHQHGARYYSSQSGLDFATAGFTYYLAAKALWRVDVDADAVLEDYCRRGFGPAAEPVRSYLQAFIERWQQCWPTLDREQRRMEALAPILYPADWLAQRRAELTQARTLAADPADARRVEFLLDGLTFLELLCAACLTADFTARTVNPDRLAALEQWVDRHRDGFWISACWFDYQRLVRGGLLKKPT